MSVKVAVLYPNDGDFDLDYYLSTHMPLVSEKWTSYGLKGWEVIQYQPGPDGAKPQYQIQATLIWDSKEDLEKALGSEETGTVMGDIPNFTKTQPVIIAGGVVKSKSH